jgi:hypothetical protein
VYEGMTHEQPRQVKNLRGCVEINAAGRKVSGLA